MFEILISCLRNEKVADMFPIKKKDHAMDRRQNEKFAIRKARTEPASVVVCLCFEP